MSIARGASFPPLLLVLTLLGGCSTQPELVKRYAKSVPMPDSTCKWASVSAFSLPPEKPKPLNVASLQDHGQSAFLDELGKKTKDPASFVRLAASSLTPPASTALSEDRTRLRRRVAISVVNNSPSPADRLSYAQITLALPKNGSARFVGWDKLQTEYGQVDLAKVSSTQKLTQSITGKIGAPAGPVAGELSSSASRETALAEEVTLRQRYVTLSGALHPWNAQIIQQSVSGIDLTGNTIVELDLKLDEDPKYSPATVAEFSQLKDDNGRPNKPGSVAVAFKEVHIPKIPGTVENPEPVVAKAMLAYRLRKVVKGMETITESDDDVELLTASHCGGEKFDLVSADDLRFSTWEISTSDWKKILIYGDPSGAGGAVDLETLEAATEFLSWLEESGPKQIGTWKVGSLALSLCRQRGFENFDCEPLNARNVQRLTVLATTWNWEKSAGKTPQSR